MPLAACRSRLPIVNMPSVEVCQGFSSGDTHGKSAPFRVRAITPIRTVTARLSLAPASFTCTTIPRPCGRATLALGIDKSVVQAYHGPRVPHTDRVRTPLYTGWDHRGVGSPLTLTDLPTMPCWLWSRKVALAPPASRCVRPRLHLRYPYRSFPEVHRVCHSPSVRVPSA